MNKRLKSAFGCAVLFVLSAVILKHGNDTGLPSEDYGMSIKEVIYMYGDAPSAVTSVSAEHILNAVSPKATDRVADVQSEPCDVLPPVLTPPQTSFASDIN